MNIIDISWPLDQGLTTYKNRSDFEFVATKQYETHAVRESRVCLSSHVGTHVDAPSHFVEQGESLHKVPLNYLVGSSVVLDLTAITSVITAVDLKKCVITASRVLFKTRNSFLAHNAPFEPEFVYLDASGAEYLAGLGVVAVGIDYLGIERNQPGHETHIALLSKGIAIIEGLRLALVEPGDYQLVCLPLALQHAEAGPARAVLLQE